MPLSNLGCAACLVTIGLVALSAQADSSPTWDEIVPVLESHCVQCHHPGGMAPFSVLTYDQTRPWAKSIARVLGEGSMPPWSAEGPHGLWKDDIRLSAADKELINDWVRTGTRRGAQNLVCSLPPTPADSTEDTMSIEFPAYGARGGESDDWAMLIPDHRFTEDTMVDWIGLDFEDRQDLHHASIHVCEESVIDGMGSIVGWDSNDYKTLMRSARPLALGLFLPGSTPSPLPEGYAMRIPAGSRLIVGVHYGPREIDSPPAPLTVNLRLPDETVKEMPPPKRFVAKNIVIPPNEEDFRWSGEKTLPHDLVLRAVRLHMHLRGSSCESTAYLPDGSVIPLLALPRYDFYWQRTYWYTQPISLPAGTRIETEMSWNNSAGNPDNPNPDQTVVIGAATKDEMGNLIMFWTPD